MITLSNSFTAKSSIEHQVSSIERHGFVLPLVLVGIIILMALIIGATMTDYHTRLQAVQNKSQTEAMLAAEAGYERALFWMSQQSDILGAIQAGGGDGTLDFVTGNCSYGITFNGFIGARPVFRLTSTGVSGRPSFTKIVDVDVVQETSGWAMGACRVPNAGTSSPTTATTPVSFVAGEIITMPLHINDRQDSPDVIDISISGSPDFMEKVTMGESRKTNGTGSDKYSSVISLFHAGIDFDQPNVRITDSAAVTSKINRFRDSTAAAYRFTPVGRAVVGNPASPCDPCAAVQLQFYVDASGAGKVRIFPNCTVRHYRRSSSYNTWDYKLNPSNPAQYIKYDIYAYHYFDPNDPNNKTVNVTDTYTTQSFGGYTSDPGGQIYVNGNVIIGGDSNSTIDPCNFGSQLVKGKITVVATGNIWIGDSILVSDYDSSGHHYPRSANGMPAVDDSNTEEDEGNPNVLGLIAQGIIKVVDPGLSSASGSYSYPANALITSPYHLHPNSLAIGVNDSVLGAARKHFYCPIGIKKVADSNYVRCLPHDVVVEAALTVGGGGWGAENVATGSTSSNPNRKEYVSSTMDNLKVHGSITEVIRGVVGLPSQNDGFLKEYTIDTRLMSGILPGDIWFSGKYIPAPAGWHDHSPE
jgi:hypothetical protein